ncbi:hypothetical protein ABZ023_33900 [Streptomyces sp. NPDC006367]|uniref:hypothetical protein n=1 Tax=unclassified Streptomyces TaxID=2593676 RepID=UPI0033B6AB30
MTISSNPASPVTAPVVHRAVFCPGCSTDVPEDLVRVDSCVGRCTPVHEDSDACRNCREWLCVGCGKHPVDGVPDLCPMCCD